VEKSGRESIERPGLVTDELSDRDGRIGRSCGSGRFEEEGR